MAAVSGLVALLNFKWVDFAYGDSTAVIQLARYKENHRSERLEANIAARFPFGCLEQRKRVINTAF